MSGAHSPHAPHEVPSALPTLEALPPLFKLLDNPPYHILIVADAEGVGIKAGHGPTIELIVAYLERSGYLAKSHPHQPRCIHMTGPPTPRLPFEYQQSITKMRADTTLTYKTAPNSLILVAFSVVEKLGYRFVSVEGGTYLYRRDTQILQI